MNTNRVIDLIRYILEEARQNEEWSFRELGPIHLIKYVYLADLYYASQNDGKTFTDLSWQFYHFGPWNPSLYSELPNFIREIGANIRTFESRYTKDGVRYSLNDDYHHDSPCSIPLAISSLLRRDIRNYGSATNDLLHYVYTTPPMTNAVPGDYLNFDQIIFMHKESVATENFDNLTDREKKKRKQRVLDIRKKIAKQREESKKKRVRPAPRYDEVFFNGTMEMNRDIELQEIENHKGLLQVNQNTWIGNWRRSHELP
ncbi:MAG: hypothetical protein CDV28_1459 [Candidatus Electronema aureum]|uniref:Uncharacterized protein n=1 Tax=Candidatus Electronema aureum TaxID=2005002 RepID=A0A521FYY7_9BACT|nr:MAG: hypothetical protein CDV28_1459 [Candidatus Electronema aureum]